MNIAAVEAGLQLIAVLESGVTTLRGLFTQLSTGTPMTDEQLATLKAQSDSAHDAIQAWHAAAAPKPAGTTGATDVTDPIDPTAPPTP